MARDAQTKFTKTDIQRVYMQYKFPSGLALPRIYSLLISRKIINQTPSSKLYCTILSPLSSTLYISILSVPKFRVSLRRVEYQKSGGIRCVILPMTFNIPTFFISHSSHVAGIFGTLSRHRFLPLLIFIYFFS